MIRRVTANMPSFRAVEFRPGFNVVIADRTKESTKLDSRNGLGKTMLVRIINHCLGASATRDTGLTMKELSGWEFGLEVDCGDRFVTVRRSVASPGNVRTDGVLPDWPPLASIRGDQRSWHLADWVSILGHMWFGLPEVQSPGLYAPTFRNLISYFIRVGKDAYLTPFEHHRKQPAWSVQVNNAFLLGLNWSDAAEWQALRDKDKALQDLSRAVQAGVLDGYGSSRGEIEAKLSNLQARAKQEEGDLASFRVHPHYERLRIDADGLTDSIHRLLNSNNIDRSLLHLYRKSVAAEEPPNADRIEALYREAKIVFSELVTRHLEDVRIFNDKILTNRRSFLDSEIRRLEQGVTQREDEIRQLSEERASMMGVLQTHGALEEYTRLQRLHLDTVEKANSMTTTLQNWKQLDERRSDLRVKRELLHQRAQRDYEERKPIRDRAMSQFNSYSQALYQLPGKLILDVGPQGFQYGVEIERSQSAGVGNMKIFCYDLTLATTWADRYPSPRLLVHDSTIFDGVDERQRARALELAATEAEAHGFQYICTLNSDAVPRAEFSPGFDFDQYVRLRLTDAMEDGCLLGFRY